MRGQVVAVGTDGGTCSVNSSPEGKIHFQYERIILFGVTSHLSPYRSRGGSDAKEKFNGPHRHPKKEAAPAKSLGVIPNFFALISQSPGALKAVSDMHATLGKSLGHDRDRIRLPQR
jgi:hypothetical protein